MTSVAGIDRDGGPPSARTWLLAILAIAAVLRIVLYAGFFGSDEVTYVESAYKLLQGDWSVEEYVGANRYGVNLPIAAFGALFGVSEWSAAAYGFLSSVAEVVLVTWFGMRMFGTRAGAIAGIVMACLPMHLHFAGRLLADPPLCLAITASFLLFYQGERSGSKLAYFAAGCAAGLSFWVKPVVAFYLLVFVAYPFLFRRWTWRWAWMAAGFALLVLANCALFLALTGDAWYLFRVMAARRASGYLAEGTAAGAIADTPHFYLVYLFGKIYHTGLLAYLAVAGILVGVAARRHGGEAKRYAFAFTLWWALGLLAVLSVLVVSIHPLMYVPKQTNYMLIFVAPLCLLAGVALAALPGKFGGLAVSATVAFAVGLAVLLQASLQAFTSNSKAAVQFARDHPTAEVYGSTNAYRAASFESLVRPSAPEGRIRSMQDLFPRGAGPSQAENAAVDRFAIVDLETVGWSAKEPVRRLQDVPSCWMKVGTLEPAGLGVGSRTVRWLSDTLGGLPAALQRVGTPAPAVVYRVPAGRCG